MPTWAYKFLIKRILQSLNIFTKKNKSGYVSLTILSIYLAFTFQRPSEGTINDSLLLLLEGMWKVYAKYIAFEKKYKIFFFPVEIFKLQGILFIWGFPSSF